MVGLRGLAARILVGVVVGVMPPAHGAEDKACVVLLHGLGRTSLAMLPIERAVKDAGFSTVNYGYPSLAAPIQELAETHLPRALTRCREQTDALVHFVGHSLGGILVRQYLQTAELPDGTRLVMLGPPNQGSELADRLEETGQWFGFVGPAGPQLGTGEASLLPSLAPIRAEVGVIAGSKTDLPLVADILPGPDDGRVSVYSTRLPEMQDFLVVDESHLLMLFDRFVIEQVIHFLSTGRFEQSSSPSAFPAPLE